MKAYIYARYSSERQKEESIEGQLRECHAYAERCGIEIVREYIDRAITGKTDDRPQFQQMIRDSKQKEVEAVIVYKTDRFSRRKYDINLYKAILHKNGVRVLSAKEHIPDGIEGILLESLMEGLAEYYSAELSQKLQRGMRECALKAKALGGTTPLGYTVNKEQKYEIEEATAAVVRMIFKDFTEGIRAEDICQKLNDMGYRTRRGNLFTKNAIYTVLKNEKYIGVYKCNDIRIENGVPAIIDKETFEKTQKLLKHHTKIPQAGRTKADYLLTGKLFCEKCGMGMSGYSGTSRNGGTYFYYRCAGRKEGACKQEFLRKDWLEEFICDATVKNMLVPDKIDLIAKRCAEISEQDYNDDAEEKFLRSKLKQTEKEIENFLSAIAQGIVTQSVKNKLVELEQQKSSLEEELKKERRKLPKMTEADIRYLLSRFQKDGEQSDEEYRKSLLNCFIHKVTVSDEYLTVYFNLAKNPDEFYQSRLFTSPSLESDIIEEGKDLSIAQLSSP